MQIVFLSILFIFLNIFPTKSFFFPGLPVHPPKNILSDNNSHKKSKSLSIKHKRGVISRSDDIVNSIQNVHKRIESCKECFVVLDRLPMQSG